jgi:uncharacterized SAM-binding protein YcdF (DUF218 family)
LVVALINFFLKKRSILNIVVCCIILFFSIPNPIYKLIQNREFTFILLDRAALNKNEHYNIIVLGAGKNNDQLLSENLRLSQEVLSRLIEGIKWSRQLPDFTLICSGPLVKGDKSQSLLLKETADMLGVDPKHIELIDQGYNTKTEAEQYTNKFDLKEPLILCTSALHMTRAKAWFEHYGVQRVYAAPSSYSAPHKPFSFNQWLPSWSSFFMWQTYLKELLGAYLVPKS